MGTPTIAEILKKYNNKPGHCTVSELRKIEKYLHTVHPKVKMFEDAFNEPLTIEKLKSIFEDVEFLIDNHEDLQGGGI